MTAQAQAQYAYHKFKQLVRPLTIAQTLAMMMRMMMRMMRKAVRVRRTTRNPHLV